MRRTTFLISLLMATLGLITSGIVQADSYRSRAERWEFTMQMRYLDEKTVKFNGGSEIKTNADIGWGFGFGYNFNDHLSLSFDIGWNSPSYEATIASADTPPTAPILASSDLTTSSMHLVMLYNFLAGPVSPFVTAGIGTTFVDSNLAYGPPSSTCWWDPYWGYYCGTYQQTYSASRFSYNTSVGVRWDMTRDVFLRASLGKHWIDMQNSSNNDFTFGRLEVGFIY